MELTGIAYLRGPASRTGSPGRNCRPRAKARLGASPNALIRLHFIFSADSMAEAPWQERRQPGPALRRRSGLERRPAARAAVLAYRRSAKSAAQGRQHFQAPDE
jgi:hypothetical protein